MKNHVFNVEVAKKLGVNAALILNNIEYWCSVNKSKNHNFYEGKYWVDMTIKSLELDFPYIGRSSIASALRLLENKKIIEVKNFNNNHLNKTRFFTISN